MENTNEKQFTQVTRKATKVIGKQLYLNQATGEIEEFNVVKIEERDANFHKIWLDHLAIILDLMGTQKIKVLTHVLQNIDRDNTIIARQSDISKELNVSLQTVSFAFKTMMEAGIMKKVVPSVYQINPDIIFKGGKGDRMNVLYQYYNSDTLEVEEIDKNEYLPSPEELEELEVLGLSATEEIEDQQPVEFIEQYDENGDPFLQGTLLDSFDFTEDADIKTRDAVINTLKEKEAAKPKTKKTSTAKTSTTKTTKKATK